MPVSLSECVLWCPKCRKDKWEVERKPTGCEGVYQHVLRQMSENKGLQKTCAHCSTPVAQVMLERKPV